LLVPVFAARGVAPGAYVWCLLLVLAHYVGARLAGHAGLEVVMDRCILKEQMKYS
jgi:hypothetical protein